MFKQILLILLLVFISSNTIAADKVPREDFIKYTDACIDVTDEIEIVYSKSEIKRKVADEIKDKLDFCLRKFDRYGSNLKWDVKSIQYYIVGKFRLIDFLTSTMYNNLQTGNNADDQLKNIIEANTNIKDKFVTYKESTETNSSTRK